MEFTDRKITVIPAGAKVEAFEDAKRDLLGMFRGMIDLQQRQAQEQWEENMDFFDPGWRLRIERDLLQRSSVFPNFAQPDFCECL